MPSHAVEWLRNYGKVLCDDGMGYGRPTALVRHAVQPAEPDLREVRLALAARAHGDALFDHYRHALEALGNEKRTLGAYLRQVAEQHSGSARLRRVIVDLIDKEDWFAAR
jgi:type I restriction enzyme M protein